MTQTGASSGRPTPRVIHQPAVSFQQPAPVQNQWYTAFDRTETVRVLRIQHMMIIVWTAAETLQARVTIDGVLTTEPAFAANVAASYALTLNADDGASPLVQRLERSLGQNNCPVNQRLPIECQAFKLELRKTTNNGAGDLDAFIQWETIE